MFKNKRIVNTATGIALAGAPASLVGFAHGGQGEAKDKTSDIVTKWINKENNLQERIYKEGEAYKADSAEAKDAIKQHGIKELTGEERAYLQLLHGASGDVRDIVHIVKYFQKHYSNYLKNFKEYMNLYNQYKALVVRYLESKGKDKDDARNEAEKLYEEKMKGFFDFLKSCNFLLSWKRQVEDKNFDVVTAYEETEMIKDRIVSLEEKITAIRELRNKNITDKTIAEKNYGLPLGIVELNEIIDNPDDFKNSIDLRKRFDLPKEMIVPELGSLEYTDGV